MSAIIGNNHFTGNFHEIEYTMQNPKKYPWVFTSYFLRQYIYYIFTHVLHHETDMFFRG
jgi:hypothetical protein